MERKTETVNGREFAVTSLPAAVSFRLWTEIVKQHGGAIAALISAQDSEADATAAIEKVCSSLDVELLDRVRKTFMGVSSVDGDALATEAQFSHAFAGRIGDTLAWMQFCLKSEYSHFFEGLASGQGLGALASAVSNTPST